MWCRSGRRIVGMSVLIEDPEIDELVQKLSAKTGEAAPDAVKSAIRERLDRLTSEEREERWDRIQELLDRVAALPELDPRPADEIIGYNEHGHFD